MLWRLAQRSTSARNRSISHRQPRLLIAYLRFVKVPILGFLEGEVLFLG